MRSFSPSRWALLSSQGKRTLPPFGFGNLLNWDFQWLIFYISSNSVQEFHNFFTVIYSVCACSVMSDSLRPHGLSPPGSSCHGIFQARIVEWVAIFSSGDLPDPEIKLASLMSPALAGRQVLYPWGAWEAPHLQQNSLKKSCLELLSPVFLFPVSEAHSKQFLTTTLPLKKIYQGQQWLPHFTCIFNTFPFLWWAFLHSKLSHSLSFPLLTDPSFSLYFLKFCSSPLLLDFEVDQN